jgi:SH3-like domain-containing protein
VGFAAAGRSRMLARDTAIIMAPRIDARAEPIESAKPLFILHKGSKVELRDSVNGWHEVRLPNGSAGWMPANSLERI